MSRGDGAAEAFSFRGAFLLAANGHGELISRPVDVGVAGFVGKPFRESDLLGALDEASRQIFDRDGLAYLRVAPDDATRSPR